MVKAKITCPFCSFTTTKIKWLNDHKVCMHPNISMLYPCNECEFTSLYQVGLKTHMTIHSSSLTSKKDIIDYPGYSNIELHDEPLDDALFEPQGAPSYAPRDEPLNEPFVEQEKNSRTTKKYSCPRCEYSTDKPQVLEQHNKRFHKKSTTGIFNCNICE